MHIRGEPKLARMLVPPKALKKEKEIEAVSLVWVIENAEFSVLDQSRIIQNFVDLTGSQAAELENVLKEYEGVFEEPKQLPPNREIDHKIPIKAGMDPINVG